MVNSVLDILINDLTLIKEALGHNFSIKKKIYDDLYPVRLSSMRNTMKYLPGNRGVCNVGYSGNIKEITDIGTLLDSLKILRKEGYSIKIDEVIKMTLEETYVEFYDNISLYKDIVID